VIVGVFARAALVAVMVLVPVVSARPEPTWTFPVGARASESLLSAPVMTLPVPVPVAVHGIKFVSVAVVAAPMSPGVSADVAVTSPLLTVIFAATLDAVKVDVAVLMTVIVSVVDAPVTVAVPVLVPVPVCLTI
jgi:hypothetical protein